MTWDAEGPHCPTCGHIKNLKLDAWRAKQLVALVEQTMTTMPLGRERRERLLNIVQDYGVSYRTAQRYVARARAAA